MQLNKKKNKSYDMHSNTNPVRLNIHVDNEQIKQVQHFAYLPWKQYNRKWPQLNKYYLQNSPGKKCLPR